jgi:hypothetical protein
MATPFQNIRNRAKRFISKVPRILPKYRVQSPENKAWMLLNQKNRQLNEVLLRSNPKLKIELTNFQTILYQKGFPEEIYKNNLLVFEIIKASYYPKFFNSLNQKGLTNQRKLDFLSNIVYSTYEYVMSNPQSVIKNPKNVEKIIFQNLTEQLN